MKTDHMSEGNVCLTYLRSFLGKPTNCLGTRNAVVLVCLRFGKVLCAMPCGKLLFSKGADVGMASVAQEQGVSCCAESDVYRSAS